CPILHVLLGFRREQPILLPGREIAVLNCQRRKRGFLPVYKRFIGSPKIALDDALRPTIGENMVGGNDENVLSRVKPEQARPQQRPAGQIERLSSFLTN